MYQTSATFRELMARPSRTLTARGMLTYPDNAMQALTATEIVSFVVTENVGEQLPLGSVSAATLALRLDNRAGEWNPGGSILGAHELDGAVLSLEMGVAHPDYGGYTIIDGGAPGTVHTEIYDGGNPTSVYIEVLDGGAPSTFFSEYYWSKIGTYIIEDAVMQEQDAILNVKGADKLANKASVLFADNLTYPQTVGGIFAAACAQAGITPKSTTFINSGTSIPIKPAWSEKTSCRDVISYVACLACGFARIDRDGLLEIVQFEHTSDYAIGTNRYIQIDKNGTVFGPFNALTVIPEGANKNAIRVAIDLDIEDTEQNSIGVQGNPLLTATSTTAISAMLAGLQGIIYDSARANWQGDPTVTTGDLMTITDKGGTALKVLVLKQELSYSVGFRMTSGNDVRGRTKGQAEAQRMRVFTPTGKLNAAALEGDINIRAGRKLNLLSDADMSIKAGANFDLGAGKGKSGIGMSNYREDNVFMWAGAGTPANAPFRVTMDGELTASSIGGGLVIPVANGGTGYNRQTIHRGTDYPSSGFGQDGDLFVFYNGQASTSWSAQTLTYGTAGQNTYFGVNRNWNQSPTAGFYRFGNGVGTSAYDFGAYAYFTAPAATNSLTFTFVTAKYYNSTWYGYSGTTNYKVALVKASNMAVILASATCYANQSQNTQTVTLTTAANMTQGDTYYIAVYFDGGDEKTNAGIVGSIEMQGKVSNSRTFDLLLKSGGEWRALFGNG